MNKLQLEKVFSLRKFLLSGNLTARTLGVDLQFFLDHELIFFSGYRRFGKTKTAIYRLSPKAKALLNNSND